MADEYSAVIGEDLFEVDGPDLFTDGDNHGAWGWGQRAAHGAATTLTKAFLAESETFASATADPIRSGTSWMMIFRVTLRRRKVQPLMMSPGLLVFPG